MKRLIVGSVVVLAALLAVAPVGAKPGQDKIAGTVTYLDQTISTSATTSDQYGTRGTWSLTYPGVSYSGRVHTLIIDGTRAVACGTITSSSEPSHVSQPFQQYVGDSGVKTQKDRSVTLLLNLRPCMTPSEFEAEYPAVEVEGQWHVHDGQPT